MRIYLPASLDQLDSASGPLTARRAHAVTPALRAMFADEDDEGLEDAAQLAAADDSLELLADRPDAPQLRCVVSVHVVEPAAAADVTLAAGGDEEAAARLDERDLLWYDASELGSVPR